MTQEPPDTDRLYVPLREAACGVSLRFFRDRDGTRCAVGFTTPDQLAQVLGPDHRYYRLTRRAVCSLAAERGVQRLIVDPGLVAAPVAPLAAPVAPLVSPVAAEPADVADPAWSKWNPQLIGLLAVSAVSGAAALFMQVIQ